MKESFIFLLCFFFLLVPSFAIDQHALLFLDLPASRESFDGQPNVTIIRHNEFEYACALFSNESDTRDSNEILFPAKLPPKQTLANFRFPFKFGPPTIGFPAYMVDAHPDSSTHTRVPREHALPKERHETPKKRARTADEVITVMNGSCFHLSAGYWHYDVCPGRNVRQYHDAPSESPDARTTRTAAFWLQLGVYESNATVNHSAADESEALLAVESPPLRYFAQRYTHGNHCDETKQGRSAEVRFVCDRSLAPNTAQVHYLLEPRICEYVVWIGVAALCDVEGFRPVNWQDRRIFRGAPNLLQGETHPQSTDPSAPAEVTHPSPFDARPAQRSSGDGAERREDSVLQLGHLLREVFHTERPAARPRDTEVELLTREFKGLVSAARGTTRLEVHLGQKVGANVGVRKLIHKFSRYSPVMTVDRAEELYGDVDELAGPDTEAPETRFFSAFYKAAAAPDQETEVRFFCDPSANKAHSIRLRRQWEAMDGYRVFEVGTAALCPHPRYAPRAFDSPARGILCQPITDDALPPAEGESPNVMFLTRQLADLHALGGHLVFHGNVRLGGSAKQADSIASILDALQGSGHEGDTPGDVVETAAEARVEAEAEAKTEAEVEAEAEAEVEAEAEAEVEAEAENGEEEAIQSLVEDLRRTLGDDAEIRVIDLGSRRPGKAHRATGHGDTQEASGDDSAAQEEVERGEPEEILEDDAQAER